jgi:2-polyprenyl-6-methoxyphenol hydroxylase-like FAD-dependent oxidoreductase
MDPFLYQLSSMKVHRAMPNIPAQPSRIPVLIVGAGPAGSTMALELARYGVPHRLVDRAAGPTDQSRALGLTTRTLELLHRTGAGEAIAHEARVMEGFIAYGAGGKRLAELPLSIDPETSRYPHEMVLPQSRTQRFLQERYERVGGRVEYGVEAVELSARSDAVEVLLRHGDGEEERVTADWVIGADGAGSLVRRIAGDNFIGTEYEEKFLLADVTLRWPLSDRHGHLFLRPGGPIVAFPYPYPGQWRLIDTSNEAETGEQAPTIERFKTLFGAFVPDMAVERAGWTSLFRIHRRLVDRYRIGRILLMGDAAHIHSPASGQGLNTGVQDAVNLAWKLALVVKGLSQEVLLDSYQPERRPVAEGVLNDSHAITELMLMHNPVVEHVRDALLHFGLGLGPVQRRLAEGISKIGVNYRNSPVVTGGAGDGVKAGDRLPDPALSDGRRLSDVVSDGLKHVLILCGDPEPLLREIARRDLTHLIAPIVMPRDLPDDGTIARLFAFRVGTNAVLVRPDLHIGWRGHGPDAAALVAPFQRALDLVFRAEEHQPSGGRE